MTTRKSFIIEAFGEQLSRLSLRPMEDKTSMLLIVQSSGKAIDELHGPSLAKLLKGDYLRCRGKSDLEGWHAQLLGSCREKRVGWDRSSYEEEAEAEKDEGDDDDDVYDEWNEVERGGYYDGRDGGDHFMYHLHGCKAKLGVRSLGAIKKLKIGSTFENADFLLLASALERVPTRNDTKLDDLNLRSVTVSRNLQDTEAGVMALG